VTVHRDPFGHEHRYGPPVGWVQPASWHSNADEDWALLCARGLRFEPYAGPTRVRIARGTCLEPLVIAGDLLTVRPVASDEALVDGALYVIDWANAAEVQAYRDEIGAPRNEPILIAKFLRYMGFGWWCQCRDSFARLDGVVVEEVVGASRPESVECRGAQIGANAATSTITQTLAGPTALTPNTYSGLNSIAVGPYPVATTLVCTATGGWSVTTGVNAEASNVPMGAGGIGASAIATNFQWNPKTNLPAATTITGNIVTESTLTLAAGATTTVYTWIFMGGVNFPATTSGAVTNLVTKVEVIKR
jgi:hypothetical protein